MIAPMPKTLAMANCSEVPVDNISLLLTAKIAYEAPAPSASRIPTVADPWPAPLLAPVKMMTPTTAHAVATHQRTFGLTLNQSQLIAPVSAGAEPSATTVPIVTPLRCTAAKKVSWYPAIPAPAQSQEALFNKASRQGSGRGRGRGSSGAAQGIPKGFVGSDWCREYRSRSVSPGGSV